MSGNSIAVGLSIVAVVFAVFWSIYVVRKESRRAASDAAAPRFAIDDDEDTPAT
jgi:hypothetical protein